MQPNLSFEQAPPISVPYRFFLTAPWFGVLAGLLLAWQGGASLASRWTPQALAMTHLLVAGYLLQAMIGALLQFVPVAAGGNVPRPSLVAAIVHPLCVLGGVGLPMAFLLASPPLFLLAAIAFVPALGIYLTAMGVALWRTEARGATVSTLRIALAGLAVTVALGGGMAISLSGNGNFPVGDTVDIHAAWGLVGWSLMLLMGVSYHVVPMFQLTPAYKPGYAHWAPLVLLGVLVLGTYASGGHQSGWTDSSLIAGFSLAGSYALITLGLQARRRRKIFDPTLIFFRVAMLALLAAAGLGISMVLSPSLADCPEAYMDLGLLAIVGVFMSAINGMLYKIIPFINWLHLQGRGGAVPNMREMIPEGAMRFQLWGHVTALILLLAAPLVPSLASLAGLALAASCGALAIILARAVGRYAKFEARLRGSNANLPPR